MDPIVFHELVLDLKEKMDPVEWEHFNLMTIENQIGTIYCHAINAPFQECTALRWLTPYAPLREDILQDEDSPYHTMMTKTRFILEHWCNLLFSKFFD